MSRQYPVMNQTYPATYRDRFGEESLLIHNDGHDLNTVIRDIGFSGMDFFSLCLSNPETAAKQEAFSTFIFDGEDLCGCTLGFDMPISVLLGRQTRQALLRVYIELGPPSRYWNNRIQLRLSFDRETFCSRLIEDSFEEALLDLEKLLPENLTIKSCFFCAFSDYSPYGKMAFGDMLCHRDNKQQYLAVQSKDDYLAVPVTEVVQETYLCPEFEKRVKGTGYRG